MANSADPDQLASSEANWSGATLFAKKGISGFSRTRVKMLSVMANSVDPVQMAPSGAIWSWSALLAKAILSETLVYEILGHLSQYISYFFIKMLE